MYIYKETLLLCTGWWKSSENYAGKKSCNEIVTISHMKDSQEKPFWMPYLRDGKLPDGFTAWKILGYKRWRGQGYDWKFRFENLTCWQPWRSGAAGLQTVQHCRHRERRSRRCQLRNSSVDLLKKHTSYNHMTFASSCEELQASRFQRRKLDTKKNDISLLL